MSGARTSLSREQGAPRCARGARETRLRVRTIGTNAVASEEQERSQQQQRIPATRQQCARASRDPPPSASSSCRGAAAQPWTPSTRQARRSPSSCPVHSLAQFAARWKGPCPAFDRSVLTALTAVSFDVRVARRGWAPRAFCNFQPRSREHARSAPTHDAGGQLQRVRAPSELLTTTAH